MLNLSSTKIKQSAYTLETDELFEHLKEKLNLLRPVAGGSVGGQNRRQEVASVTLNILFELRQRDAVTREYFDEILAKINQGSLSHQPA